MTALLMPGTGSQRPGLLRELARGNVGARLLRRASTALGRDVAAGDTVGSNDENDVVQLVLFLCAVASAEELAEADVRIDAVAGHSVGAYAAAVAARALDFEDGLRLVVLRGETMKDAFPEGYGMAAILGLGEVAVAEIVARSAGSDPLYVANVNASDNVAISGADAALERAVCAALAGGARAAKRLDVRVPSHSPLVARTRVVLDRALDAVDVRAPALTLVGGLDGRALRDAAAVRRDLAGGMAAPVKWADATRVLYERGVRLFIEAVPGDVLTRLAAAAFPDARTVALDVAGIASATSLAALF